MVERKLLQSIKYQCFRSKVIILLGARQVGKTALLKKLMDESSIPALWLNADEADIRQSLSTSNTSDQLKKLIGNYKLVIIDEAQQIDNIGLKLKLIHDNYSDIQLIATGSSAFDLKNKMTESLTGRKREFYLYPLSYEELKSHNTELIEKRYLESRLIYGSYPEVVTNPGQEHEVLLEIGESYLYKDILKMDGIRKSSVLEKLLQALAFQIGQEVSYHELANTIGNINTATVEKYINLLEKSFIIFKLSGLQRNYRNELKKAKKYYFYDLGIRNMLIGNFQHIGLRADLGQIWENYIISERFKFNAYRLPRYLKSYFWRTKDQAEIDYIEEVDGFTHAYEIKNNNTKTSFPKSFLQAYPNHTTQLIHQQNYDEFIANKKND